MKTPLSLQKQLSQLSQLSQMSSASNMITVSSPLGVCRQTSVGGVLSASIVANYPPAIHTLAPSETHVSIVPIVSNHEIRTMKTLLSHQRHISQ